MKKKLLVALLVVMSVFLLVGCSSKDDLSGKWCTVYYDGTAKVEFEIDNNSGTIDVDGVDAGRLGDCLAQEYGICVRAGAHCAPLMHRSLGTEDRGAVRFSFSYFNTEEEVERGIRAVKECVTTLRC